MKIFAAIIAIVCLLISGIPCCSFDDCGAETAVEESTSTESEENECGQCSPFLLCGTCSGFVSAQDKITSSEVSVSYAAPAVNRRCSTIASEGFIPRVWQPPKLMMI